jgi:hypothetical protein
MSEIEDFVVGELRKEREMIPIERGFVWQRGEDVTRVWFKPTTVPPRTPGERRLANNQAAEQNRAGKLWFCFFRPAIAGESGIGDLVRFWGGEAVYNSHDRDDEIGPIIATIGCPAIVEAEVPIAWFGNRGLGLALNVGRRFVVAEGTPTREPLHIECYIKHQLSAELIRNVHLHPSAGLQHLEEHLRRRSPLVAFERSFASQHEAHAH